MSGKERNRKSKKWKRKLLNLEVFPCLGFLFIHFLALTIRQEWIGIEKLRNLQREGQPVILVFWHGRLLMMPLINRGRRTGALISHHGDGELITRIIRYFGYYSVRGSTSRGGMAAVRKLVGEMKNGSDAAIAPDGPRGPPYRVQSGAILLAHMSGCPLIPVAFGASKGKFIPSWDQFLIPYPFSEGVFIFDDPIWVGKKENWEDLEKKRQLLGNRLNKITKEADEYFRQD